MGSFTSRMGKTPAPNLGVVDWSAVPFYVVGTTTGNVLRKMPASPFTPSSQNIVGEGSGTGEALAELIIEDQRRRTPKLPLLYLTGDKNRDTLPKLVKAAGIDLEPLQVYCTRGSQIFSTGVKELLERHQPFGECDPKLDLKGIALRLTMIHARRSKSVVDCVLCPVVCGVFPADPAGALCLFASRCGRRSRDSVL